MDLSTIRSKLLNNKYENINEFDNDCNLIFINTKLYNTNKKSKVLLRTLY